MIVLFKLSPFAQYFQMVAIVVETMFHLFYCTFTSIPEDPDVREQWASFCGQDSDWDPPFLAKLCSEHLTANELPEGHFTYEDSSHQSVKIKEEEEGEDMSSYIKISRNPEADGGYGRAVKEFYVSGAFCDLDLVCGGLQDVENGSRDLRTVSCHRLVLSSLSPVVREALRGGADPTSSSDPGVMIRLPDHGAEEVRRCIDAIYACLAGEALAEDLVSGSSEIVAVLGVDMAMFEARRQQQVDEAPREQQEDQVKDRLEVDKLEVECDAYEPEPESEEVEEEEEEEIPVSKKRRRRGKPRGQGMKREVKRDLSQVPQKLWDEDEVEGNIAEVRRSLSGGSGSIRVELMEEPLNPARHTYSVKRERSLFMAILGLRGGEGDSYVYAVPLVCSPASEEDLSADEVGSSHSRFCAALRAVFGLSRVETHHQSHVFSRMGVGYNPNASRMYYNLKRR